jgi:hypothetical protein
MISIMWPPQPTPESLKKNSTEGAPSLTWIS